MIMAWFDRTLMSHVDNSYEQWRMKRYRHLYQCNSCGRAFETVKPARKCIGCRSSLTELNRHDLDLHRSVKRLNYYCHSCRQTYFSPNIRTHCEKCGNRVYQNYPWSAVRRRDRLLIKIGILSYLSKHPKLVLERMKKPRRQKILPRSMSPERRRSDGSLRRHLPAAKLSAKAPKLKDEELPSGD